MARIASHHYDSTYHDYVGKLNLEIEVVENRWQHCMYYIGA